MRRGFSWFVVGPGLSALVGCGPQPAGTSAAGPDTGASAEVSTSTGGTTTNPVLTASGVGAESSSGGTTAGEENGFLPRPDVAPGATPCDPQKAMPCPEGMKCSVAGVEDLNHNLFAGRPACFPVLGDKQKGEACDLGEFPTDGLDDCGAGTVCLGAGGGWGPEATCVAFCGSGISYESTPSCDDPAEFCFGAVCGDCSLSLCLPACDPLVQDCANGYVCRYAWSYLEQGFVCEPPFEGSPTAGETCDLTRCAFDSWCVYAEEETSLACGDTETCCAPLCDLDAVNTCPGADMGESCQPFFDAPFDPVEDPWGVQYNDLGYCVVP